MSTMNSDKKTTPKSSSPKTIEELYQKKTDREHVLLRPDMYIGDITKHTEYLWIFEFLLNYYIILYIIQCFMLSWVLLFLLSLLFL